MRNAAVKRLLLSGWYMIGWRAREESALCWLNSVVTNRIHLTALISESGAHRAGQAVRAGLCE